MHRSGDLRQIGKYKLPRYSTLKNILNSSREHKSAIELFMSVKKCMTKLNPSNNFLGIKERLEDIDKITSEEGKRNIHFKSLRNFIFYYSSLKRDKQKAIALIEEYIQLIERNEFYLTEEQSKVGFDLFITPIGRIYRKQLNFSSEFAVLFEIMLYIIPNSLAWLIFQSKLLIILILPFYLIYWSRYINRYYQSKIFGYRY